MIDDGASSIQLLKYPIPPPPARTALLHATKSVTLQYLGNRESYQRSAGVKTTRKNFYIKIERKTLPEAQRIQGIESIT